MFDYFYHEILRRTIVSFGTLFNSIQIQHKNDSDATVSVIDVPLAYGPTQKFLARLQQQPNLDRPVQITLPRMSFEFVGLSYDSSRKLSPTQSFIAKDVNDGTKTSKSYMPIPYNMEFELSIYTKLNDDMLQIIEQIVPYFQPSYNISVNLVDKIGEKRDIPIVLESINMSDEYEGDFETRRALIYTLRFTAKTYLFGPITDSSKDIIRKVSIGYVAGGAGSTSRDVTYRSEPTATKNYVGNPSTTLSENISLSDTAITLDDASSIPEKSYIQINEETLYVSKKNGNILTVNRGMYSTKISEHVSGNEIYVIDSNDNALIEVGDTFGFDGGF